MMNATSCYPVIGWERYSWLLKVGVPPETLASMSAQNPLCVATGRRRAEGLFDDDEGGQPFLVFEEPDDMVFWQPRTGEIATAFGNSFALGEAAVDDPGTYAFDNHLNLFGTPLDWLRARCNGCVVLNWSRAFAHLRHAPRIAVSEDVLFLYRRHMKPTRMPETLVISDSPRVAA